MFRTYESESIVPRQPPVSSMRCIENHQANSFFAKMLLPKQTTSAKGNSTASGAHTSVASQFE